MFISLRLAVADITRLNPVYDTFYHAQLPPISKKELTNIIS